MKQESAATISLIVGRSRRKMVERRELDKKERIDL